MDLLMGIACSGFFHGLAINPVKNINACIGQFMGNHSHCLFIEYAVQ